MAWSEHVLDEKGRTLTDARDVSRSSAPAQGRSEPASHDPQTQGTAQGQGAQIDRALAGPGWHLDPAGAYPQRWWDGGVWSEHVLDEKGRTLTDPRGGSHYPAPTMRPAPPPGRLSSGSTLVSPQVRSAQPLYAQPTAERRRPHYIAGTFYATVAAGCLLITPDKPAALLGALLVGAYAAYLFRGGRIVIFFFVW